MLYCNISNSIVHVAKLFQRNCQNVPGAAGAAAGAAAASAAASAACI